MTGSETGTNKPPPQNCFQSLTKKKKHTKNTLDVLSLFQRKRIYSVHNKNELDTLSTFLPEGRQPLPWTRWNCSYRAVVLAFDVMLAHFAYLVYFAETFK